MAQRRKHFHARLHEWKGMFLMSRLTLITAHSSKAWETDGGSVWSESIDNLFCFVFPNNSHLKRDSPFRLCEWASSPLHILLCEQQQLDDLFPECSMPTGGLFQLNFGQHFYLPSSKIPDILELKHLLSCFFFLSRCFHSLINKVFISCLHSSLF